MGGRRSSFTKDYRRCPQGAAARRSIAAPCIGRRGVFAQLSQSRSSGALWQKVMETAIV